MSKLLLMAAFPVTKQCAPGRVAVAPGLWAGPSGVQGLVAPQRADLLDQGLNPRALRGQVDSFLRPPRKP